MNPSYSEYVEVYVVPFHNSDQIHIQFKITLLSSKYLLTGSVIGYNSIIPKTELFPLHSQKQRLWPCLSTNVPLYHKSLQVTLFTCISKSTSYLKYVYSWFVVFRMSIRHSVVSPPLRVLIGRVNYQPISNTDEQHVALWMFEAALNWSL